MDLAERIRDEVNHRLSLMLGDLIEELGQQRRWTDENLDPVIAAVAIVKKKLDGKNG